MALFILVILTGSVIVTAILMRIVRWSPAGLWLNMVRVALFAGVLYAGLLTVIWMSVRVLR